MSFENWPGPITAITLFTENLTESKEFYSAAFDLPIHYEDDASAVYLVGGIMINLLSVTEASALITPAQVGSASSGARAQLTITVDDVDATCARLATRGVALLNGPMDRPWGIRTAAFADPSGHVWEIAS